MRWVGPARRSPSSPFDPGQCAQAALIDCVELDQSLEGNAMATLQDLLKSSTLDETALLRRRMIALHPSASAYQMGERRHPSAIAIISLEVALAARGGDDRYHRVGRQTGLVAFGDLGSANISSSAETGRIIFTTLSPIGLGRNVGESAARSGRVRRRGMASRRVGDLGFCVRRWQHIGTVSSRRPMPTADCLSEMGLSYVGVPSR